MTYKTLGQAAPTADTDTDLYTVGAATEAVTSTLTVCNRGTSVLAFRVAVRPAGATLADEHYVYYGATLGAKSTFAATIGLALEATDVVTVRADSGDASFSLFGQEIT